MKTNRLKSEYPIAEAHLYAKYVRGQAIPARTWRTWCRMMKIPRYAQVVTCQQAKDLFTLAYMRRCKPKTRFNLVDIRRKQQEGFNPARCLPVAPGTNHTCYGKQLPSIIKKVLSRDAQEKSIERAVHRWAKAEGLLFARSMPLTHEQVQWWIDYAAKQYAKHDYLSYG